MVKMAYARTEIPISENIEIILDDKIATVKGPKGELKKDFSHSVVNIYKKENKIIIDYYLPRKKERAQVGTIASHIKNMIKGVTEGFIYKMKTVYSHFPFTVKVDKVKREVLIENFLGERAPRKAKIVGNAKVTVKNDTVLIEGIDIEEVGQTTANIQRATRIKNKDPRIFMDGIYVYMKGGKELVKGLEEG